MINLKLEDLASTCAKCKGSGRFTEVTGGGNAIGMGPASYTGNCPDCKGEGIKFTDAGNALKTFVQMLRGRGMIG